MPSMYVLNAKDREIREAMGAPEGVGWVTLDELECYHPLVEPGHSDRAATYRGRVEAGGGVPDPFPSLEALAVALVPIRPGWRS